jgi:hypothetical protein
MAKYKNNLRTHTDTDHGWCGAGHVLLDQEECTLSRLVLVLLAGGGGWCKIELTDPTAASETQGHLHELRGVDSETPRRECNNRTLSERKECALRAWPEVRTTVSWLAMF